MASNDSSVFVAEAVLVVQREQSGAVTVLRLGQRVLEYRPRRLAVHRFGDGQLGDALVHRRPPFREGSGLLSSDANNLSYAAAGLPPLLNGHFESALQ